MSAVYTKGVGTPGYTAPEVLIGGGGSYNGRLADVFSSGLSLTPSSTQVSSFEATISCLCTVAFAT